MNKTANCLKMLQYLNSGRVYKISELAERLETNPRNIIEYRNELENAGYVIISIAGKYGGYKLDETSTLPTVKLTADEKLALVEGAGYLAARNDFLHKAQYESAMSKVYSAVNHTDNREVLPTVITRFPLAMSEEEISRRYNAVQRCIYGRLKLKITYLSAKNEQAQRTIHPYNLYMYNNAWFVIAFDELRGEVKYFKLNRIKAFEVRDGERFRRLLSYKASDYVDRFGMKNNGEWYEFELELTGKYAMLVQERIYGRDQVVTPIDAERTRLKVTMQNKTDVVSFVMGFGRYCKVLEPQWLKEEVAESCRLILDGLNSG